MKSLMDLPASLYVQSQVTQNTVTLLERIQFDENIVIRGKEFKCRKNVVSDCQ